MLKGLDTSAVKYISALSPTAVGAAGSTNPFDFSKFTFGTVLLHSGSTGAATVTATVLRSATSNGTFQGTGASLNAAVAGKLHARSFVVESSAVWHRVYYTQVGAGSPVCTITLIAQGPRAVPIDQDTNTTSYSVVAP